jgi:hypothetical protein
VENVPPTQHPYPLDYGGQADRRVNALQRRFRRWAVIGMAWGGTGIVLYGLFLRVGFARWEEELPFGIVIAGLGALPALFLIPGGVGTFFPAPWARMSMLLGGYATLGASIIQMMAYLATGTLLGGLAYVGMVVVVVQLCLAGFLLYVFHDEAAEAFYGG